jgi:hypothetical protein
VETRFCYDSTAVSTEAGIAGFIQGVDRGQSTLLPECPRIGQTRAIPFASSMPLSLAALDADYLAQRGPTAPVEVVAHRALLGL